MSAKNLVRVVNVDDDPANLYAKSHILRRAGLEVLEAVTGREALRLIEEVKPDLVVLDMKLPDMNGLEVCRRIKANPKTAQVLVLQTSATFVTREDRVRGLEGGADAYLAQPYGSDELLATVRALLRIQAAEERRRESEQKYQTLFALSPSGIVLIDPSNGAIVDCNERVEDLLGYTANELKQLRLQDVEADLAPAEVMERLQKMTETGAGEYETRRRTRDGEVRDMRVLKRAVTVNGRRLFLAVWEDITERKRNEAKLREADRRKDEFLAMLAHELRNPLAPISNAVGVLRAGAPDHVAMTRLHEIIGRQVSHLSRLVDDLLDVSRITQGKVNLRREPVEIKQVFAAALETTRPLMEAKRHHVEFTLPGEPLWIEGDAVRLAQIVGNLLNNAAKYSDERGSILLSAERVQDEVLIRVRDSGIGIAPEVLPHVFEMFTQAQRGADRGQGGLGIGLSLVERLTALHGGKVEASSEGLGRGSEFRVRLPLIPQPAPADGITWTGGAQVSRRRILVVDDNEDSAESLAMLLQLNEHTVEVALNAVAALQTATRLQPEILLLDIGLPGMDGFELARRLRTMPETRDAVLIALTGYGQAEDLRLSREAGFDHHLVKPVDIARLFALVGSAPRNESESA